MPKIDHQTVENVLIPIPPMDEQQMIARIIQTIGCRILTASRRADVLKSFISSMLHLLMTGQVRVIPKMICLSDAASRMEKRQKSSGFPDEKLLQEIVRRIVEAVAPEKIILFGSAARGEMGPDSDVDLLVVKSNVHRRATAQMIEESLIGVNIPTDIIVATPEDIERHKDTIGLIYRWALREGRVVYAS